MGRPTERDVDIAAIPLRYPLADPSAEALSKRASNITVHITERMGPLFLRVAVSTRPSI